MNASELRAKSADELKQELLALLQSNSTSACSARPGSSPSRTCSLRCVRNIARASRPCSEKRHERREQVSRTLTGRVSSNKMDKTITVVIEASGQQPIYGKFVRHVRPLHAHDEHNECHEGDVVTIEQCRPIRSQAWRLVRIETPVGQ